MGFKRNLKIGLTWGFCILLIFRKCHETVDEGIEHGVVKVTNVYSVS